MMINVKHVFMDLLVCMSYSEKFLFGSIAHYRGHFVFETGSCFVVRLVLKSLCSAHWP